MTIDPFANEIDEVRAVLRNPKKLLDVKHAANPRHVHDFVHQRFAHCPLFYFDETLSAQANRLGIDYPDVMERLMPDVRLPFPSMITVTTMPKEDGPLAFDLLWESGSKIRSQMLISTRAEVGGEGLLSIAPCSYMIYPDTGGRDRPFLPVELYYGDLLWHRNPKAIKATSPEAGRNLAAVYAAIHLLGIDRPDGDNRDIPLIQHLEIHDPIGGLNHKGGAVGSMYLSNDTIADYLFETTGHVRRVAALLVLLNLRDYVTRIIEQPARPGRYRHRGVSAPYMTTRVVTLIIPEPKVIRALQKRAAESVRARQRRHSVRGHWMIRTRQPSCIHLFTKLDENRMRCSRCDGLRRWRRAHERGDASLGYVRHEEYKVEHAGAP